MKRHFFLSGWILCISFSGLAQTQNTIDNISTYLTELSQDENFGASVAILKDDELLFQKAYGYANREHKVRNKINTSFNIASVGKMFTAVATLQLYEQGKLDLNIPVGKYIPNFPHQGIRDSVTVHQLLTHSSGLPLWFSRDFPIIPKSAYLELEDYLPFFEKIFINEKKGRNKIL